MVDVDTELGLVRVVEIATAQDVGKAINPQAVEGQIEGGIAQGLGLALMEEIQVVDGEVRNASFTDYLIPTVLDMPPVRLDVLELGDPEAPYGLRGVGEPPTISSTPAIVCRAARRHRRGAHARARPPRRHGRARDARPARRADRALHDRRARRGARGRGGRRARGWRATPGPASCMLAGARDEVLAALGDAVEAALDAGAHGLDVKLEAPTESRVEGPRAARAPDRRRARRRRAATS